MSWHQRPFAALDFETTGVDTATDRAVTAAFLVIDGHRVDHRGWLINPGIDIPADATAVHGITTEKARADGVAPAAALAEIRDAVAWAWGEGLPLVVMNAPFDLTLLAYELVRHGLPAVPVGPVVDPLVIDRAVDRYRRGKRTLTALCETYGVRQGDAHDAAGDCLSAARVAYRLACLRPDVVGVDDLAALQAAQAGWHRAWAEHFESYLRSKGGQPDAVIPRGWPVAEPAHQAVA